jgi:homoserine kinase
MRALLPGALSLLDVRGQISMVARVVAACGKQDLGLLARALGDRISKPARSPRIPGFADAEAAARKAGALAVVLCGSGPSVLAVLPPGAPTRDVEAAMRDALNAAEVFVTTPAPEVVDHAVPLP